MRIEPGEIEAALRSLPGLPKPWLAFLTGTAAACLTAVVETKYYATVDPDSVRASLAETLPRSHVPQHIHVAVSLPRDASGKIARREALALPKDVPTRPPKHRRMPRRRCFSGSGATCCGVMVSVRRRIFFTRRLIRLMLPLYAGQSLGDRKESTRS